MSLVKLGDIARECRSTYSGNKSGIPIVGLEHLTPGDIVLHSWDIDTDNTFSKSFKKGQVLLGRRRVYLKKASVAPFDGICSGDITVIEAIPEKLHPDLLPFIIQNDRFFEFAIIGSAGSLSPRVKWEYLKEYEINLPELNQQGKLVELLTSGNELKHSYQEMILATDEMVKSQFIEILNSAEKKVAIGDVLSRASKGKTPQYVEHSNVRVMNQACVHWDGMHWENVKYQDPGKLSNKEALKSFDILLNSTGTGTLGRCNIFFKPDDDYTYIPDGHLTVLNTNQDVIRPWLLVYFIKLEDIQREIYDDCVTGSTNQVDLVRKNFLKIRIPLPDMASQIRFDEIVAHADKSKFELKQAIEKIDKVMRGLMQ